jgi:ArsR family transcriptional regulator
MTRRHRPNLARSVTEFGTSTLATALLDEHDADELAAAFRVVADPARLRILSAIANAPDGEVTAGELVAPLGRSQPTVSHHLAVLTDAGLVRRDKRGRQAWYRTAPEQLAILRNALATAKINV